MNRFASIVAGLSLAFVGTSTTIAATINVPGDYPTIQEAINASSDGDTIQLVQGLYTESNINVNSTVTIQGTVVDGDPVTIVQRLTDGQPVFVISNGNATLRGLQILPVSGTFGTGISITGGSPTIDNCYISGHTSSGISCVWSNPHITNCTISANSAVSGGGIYCRGSESTISGCTITGNTAGTGGGIYVDLFSPTISNCHITGNTANANSNAEIGGPSGFGGGIYSGPNKPVALSGPTITDCHITDNRVTGALAFAGGGIATYQSIPHLIGGTVSGNTNWVDLPANISGTVTQSLRGEQSDLGTIILEDSTVCGTGEYNITGVLIEHRGENHISDCVDEGDLNGDGDVDTDDLNALHDALGIELTDVNNNGCVDIHDLLYVIEDWGEGCTP